MPKADNKTKPTNVSVTCYLASIAHDRKRQDAMAINSMMRRLTGVVPKMWGNAIIGFGNTHYKYASGREGDWFLVGFASRKANLVLYIVPGFDKYSIRNKPFIACWPFLPVRGSTSSSPTIRVKPRASSSSR